jgi:hypothetical protein
MIDFVRGWLIWSRNICFVNQRSKVQICLLGNFQTIFPTISKRRQWTFTPAEDTIFPLTQLLAKNEVFIIFYHHKI